MKKASKTGLLREKPNRPQWCALYLICLKNSFSHKALSLLFFNSVTSCLVLTRQLRSRYDMKKDGKGKKYYNKKLHQSRLSLLKRNNAKIQFTFISAIFTHYDLHWCHNLLNDRWWQSGCIGRTVRCSSNVIDDFLIKKISVNGNQFPKEIFWKM